MMGARDRCLPLVAVAGLASATPAVLSAQVPLYRTDAYTVTDTSVQQGPFAAIALSPDTIVSSYPRSGREMRFRFSLNAQDNEFRPGTEHTIYIRPREGRITTPLYAFGQESPPHHPSPGESGSSEEGIAEVTIRLDLRNVLQSFRERGHYDPPQGSRIRREDFHSVYAIGDTEPLGWDVGALRRGSSAELTDADGDGIFTTTVPVAAEYTRPVTADGRALWVRRLDISAFPQLQSSQRLLDALYRMSLEELQQLVREDGALSAGAKWPGVWTRDVAYASILGLALVAPDAVRRSLLAKVDSAGRIIQDTGTGGSWPVSTDRMTWALAAWELYAATGDAAWLRRAYDVISRSAEADLHAALDPVTGLVTGETSFMDWREQSYPRWMEPRDIAMSAAVGTNVVHYATYGILASMAIALGEEATRWSGVAERIRDAINRHLWLSDRAWYANFRYGRSFHSLVPRSDGLGTALSIIYGVPEPERRATVLNSTPVVQFGTPIFWPYIPNTPAYHNAAIWPFVTAYAAWAAAEGGHTAAVEHALAAVYRPAALFLTNKENMVASTGHFEGTALNSDRQLWSVAGNLATHYRVLFGIRLEPDRMVLRPMVPPAYGGDRTLHGLRYRDATVTVTVRGFGNGIAHVRLDGRPIAVAEVPASLTGTHALEIQMNGEWPATRLNTVNNATAPDTPAAALHGDSLRWAPVSGAVSYSVYRNGLVLSATRDTSVVASTETGLAEYQVLAVDSAGRESFLSEPARVVPDGVVLQPKPDEAIEREHAGFSGAGYVTLSRERNTTVSVPVSIRHGGVYVVEARYSNGSGPVNTDSKAAVRSLFIDGRPAGVLVMPQRGSGSWFDWGYSTQQRVRLGPGTHMVTLSYMPLDENMDRRVNTALLDHLRLTLLSAEPAP